MTEIIPAVEVSHSKFSPSGSSRWLACPGSIQLEEQLNLAEQPSSIYALEGTAAHEIAAMCLTQSCQASKFLGHEIMGFTVDTEMVRAIQVYLDYVHQYRSFESRFLVEQRVDLSFLEENMKGTADCIIENPGEVHVFDYKHGKGVLVEANDGQGGPNTQLGLYGIGTLFGIFQRRGSLDHIEKVYLHIVQPRCPHKEGPTRVFETTVEELQVLSKRARQQIANACSEAPTFEPGDKQCQWCPASPVCRHLAAYNLKLAQLEFKDLQTPDTATPPNPNALSKAEVALILKRSKLMENWLKSVFTFALNELRVKRLIPEFKLVRGRANRIWKDIEEAEEALKKLGVNEDDMYTKKFASPSQAERLVGNKRKEDLKSLIVKPLGKITIAHESDPRPAADPNDDAVNEFAQFQGEE